MRQIQRACHTSITGKFSNAAFLLLVGYLWILPVSHTTTIRELLFWSLSLITLWAARRNEINLHLPLPGAWAVYTAVALLSLSYALDPLYSLSEIKGEIGYGMLIMLVAASWIRDSQTLSRLLWGLIAGNAFLACYAIIKGVFFHFSPVLGSAPFQIGVGKFSTYLVITIPFILAQALLASKRKVSLLLAFLLFMNFAALYFTENRAGFLAVFIELLLMAGLLLHYRISVIRRKVLIMMVVFLSVLLIGSGFLILAKRGEIGGINSPGAGEKTWHSLSNDKRLDAWRFAIDNIRRRPLSGGGFGLEAFRMLNPEYPKTHWPFWHVHNTFLNKAVQMGIPGVLAFCLLLLAVLRELLRSLKYKNGDRDSMVYAFAGIVMLAGMVVKNLTDDFFMRDNALMFWLLVAAIIGTLRGEAAKTLGQASDDTSENRGILKKK